MSHDISDKEKDVLDVTFKVLDKGHIRLVDYSGTDKRVVQSARVSYGDGTKTVREDKGLIDYLLRNGHLSPFEMVNFTFHIKAPILMMRQLIRHRAARVNEISGRYSVLKDEFYLPDKNRLAKQSTDNKQGSGDIYPASEAERLINAMEIEQEDSYTSYKAYLSNDMAKELARINLPLSTYTEWYWNMDLRNLMNFLKLRMDTHAQYEIRVYANIIYDIVKSICPYTMESFKNHILNGCNFSEKEIQALRILVNNVDFIRVNNVLSKKEYTEFCKKLGCEAFYG
jgi:thymidylate synthase (FAD)